MVHITIHHIVIRRSNMWTFGQIKTHVHLLNMYYLISDFIRKINQLNFYYNYPCGKEYYYFFLMIWYLGIKYFRQNLERNIHFGYSHYVIKFVSDLRQVGVFLGTLVSSTNKTYIFDPKISYVYLLVFVFNGNFRV